MRTFDLGGIWKIRSLDGRYSLEGRVPGSLFADLEAAGEFGPKGLFWRENNRDALAVADRDFEYSRSFQLDENWAEAVPTFLEADGLDTLATISINGRELAKTKNMHRRYRFEVGGFIKPGENSISIRFANSLEYCRKEIERRKLWHAYVGLPEFAFPGFNTIRKSHCSYGWDWGPIVPDVGIWRSLRLARYEAGRIATPRVVQRHGAGPKVTLEIFANVEVAAAPTVAAGLSALVSTLTHPSGRTQAATHDAAGRAVIEVEEPQLWWPNGLGEQPLYALETRLEQGGRVLDARRLSLGLRTLTVARDPDEWGQKFEFVVNGRSFFAMGADYIPEDVALSRVSRERTETLIRDSVAANFNCLRVWGGGVYPSEDFYDLCDRYGLVVWQDLMFACALYDVRNPEFKAEIEAEVRDNLERLRHRASLGLVCGNNEMEVGLVEWGISPTPEEKAEYLEQYEQLFAGIASELCPEVFYWPASPSSGGGFDHPNDPTRGDCHFWEVWHGNKDFSEFTKHYFRFMSEFGFESFPSAKTIERFTEPGDRNMLSPVMQDHQRCLAGNGKILNYIARYLRFPRDFEGAIYLSQVSQAEAIRAGIEHWRRNRGRCMGSVYWQLNDNWPVASWSSIDSEGRWKLLHYAAKRSYAPRLISSVHADFGARIGAGTGIGAPAGLPEGNGHFRPDSAQLRIHVSNEAWAEARGRFHWELRSVAGASLERGDGKFAVAPFSAAAVAELDFSSRVQGRKAPRESLLFYRAELEGGEVLRGFHAFMPYSMLELEEPGLELRWLPGPGPLGRVSVSAKKPALFVELDHEQLDLKLSDNGFHLEGGDFVELEILEARPRGAKELPPTWKTAGWRLRSLIDG